MTQVQASKAGTLSPEVLPLSVEAYHALGEMGLIPRQTELLYGQVFRKMSKSPLDSFLALRLLRLLQALVPTGYLCRPEQPITCHDSEPEPDLAVVCGREEDFRQEHPGTAELVIEVCVTSHDYDRSKLRAYANAGVKECWYVLARDRQIEAHRRPAGDQFAERVIHGPDGRITSVSVPEVALDLEALFST